MLSRNRIIAGIVNAINYIYYVHNYSFFPVLKIVSRFFCSRSRAYRHPRNKSLHFTSLLSPPSMSHLSPPHSLSLPLPLFCLPPSPNPLLFSADPVSSLFYSFCLVVLPTRICNTKSQIKNIKSAQPSQDKIR